MQGGGQGWQAPIFVGVQNLKHLYLWVRVMVRYFVVTRGHNGVVMRVRVGVRYVGVRYVGVGVMKL